MRHTCCRDLQGGMFHGSKGYRRMYLLRSMYRNMSGGVPIDEDGLAEAYAKVTPEHESAAIEAKEECPVAVIMIEE